MTVPRQSAPGEPAGAPQWVPLLYHELRPEASTYSYVLPCARFAEHLRLFDRLRREAPTGYLPQITFDDGHASNHAYALPMLGEAGVLAHFFITAGLTGKRSGYMAAAQLRELHAAGHTVGAHGWSHALLTQCNDAELRQELQDSKAALEDWLGAAVTGVSLPGGRGNARVLRACRDAGYTTVWTSVPGAVPSVTEPVVGRFNILAAMTDEALTRLLDPASGALRRASRMSRAKLAAQRLLGDRMYARLWAAVNRQERDAEGPGARDEMPAEAVPAGARPKGAAR